MTAAPAAQLRQSRPAWALPTGLGLAVLALLLTLLFKNDAAPLEVDQAWHDAVGGTRAGPLTAVAKALSFLGGPFSLVLCLALLAWLLLTRRWGGAFLLFATVMLTSVAAQGLKHIVDRPRPADPMVTVDHGSFPSGHMVTALSLAIVMLAVLEASRRATVIALVLCTLVMAWDRTYLAAHWISDTVSGAVVGAAVALVLWWLSAPLLANDRVRAGKGSVPPERLVG